MSAGSWFVYMIQSAKGKLYTGITTDIERRFLEHQTGKGGAKFFRSDRAVKVVYSEECKDRSQASIREAAIKKMNRAQKQILAGITKREEE